MTGRRPARLAACALLLAGMLGSACGSEVDAGGSGVDAGNEDDPLAVSDEVEAGSLDELHRTIISVRCSGQPGLCHNGQFEPNLSTPALFYDYAVRRPALEKPDRLRVVPGDPDASFLVDKIRNRDVSTQMPLGAEPLEEEEIQAIEAWIEDGALRRAGDEQAPVLNNPPRRPEIAIYSAGGQRLDVAGPVQVTPGTTLTLRHSVSDFETPDDEIAFGAFLVQTADGRRLAVSPGQDDPTVGVTTHDPGGPMGNGDLLNRRLTITIGDSVDLVDEAGVSTSVPSAGLSFTLLAVYVDVAPGGIATFTIGPSTLEVE